MFHSFYESVFTNPSLYAANTQHKQDLTPTPLEAIQVLHNADGGEGGGVSNFPGKSITKV